MQQKLQGSQFGQLDQRALSCLDNLPQREQDHIVSRLLEEWPRLRNPSAFLNSLVGDIEHGKKAGRSFRRGPMR